MHLDALSIYERALGPKNQKVALTLSGISETYLALGSKDAVEPFLTRLVELEDKLFVPLSNDLLLDQKSLGRLLLGTSRSAQAEDVLCEAVEALDAAPDDQAIGYSSIVRLYAVSLMRSGRFAEAEQHLFDARDLAVRMQGSGGQQTRAAWDALASLYEAWLKTDQATHARSMAKKK